MSNKHAAETYKGSGTNTGDTLFTTANVHQHELFTLMSSAGAVDVWVTLDGVNFSTAALALEDQSATANSTYVLVTTAGHVYKFWGKYLQIRVKQNGATAATATLICGAGA
jgi:hypothetical protein